jgi:hypothetical protein
MFLDFLAAGFSLLAAIFWFRAGTIRVPRVAETIDDIGSQKSGEFNAAIEKMGRWNRAAATAAGVAALSASLSAFSNLMS